MVQVTKLGQSSQIYFKLYRHPYTDTTTRVYCNVFFLFENYFIRVLHRVFRIHLDVDIKAKISFSFHNPN